MEIKKTDFFKDTLKPLIEKAICISAIFFALVSYIFSLPVKADYVPGTLTQIAKLQHIDLSNPEETKKLIVNYKAGQEKIPVKNVNLEKTKVKVITPSVANTPNIETAKVEVSLEQNSNNSSHDQKDKNEKNNERKAENNADSTQKNTDTEIAIVKKTSIESEENIKEPESEKNVTNQKEKKSVNAYKTNTSDEIKTKNISTNPVNEKKENKEANNQEKSINDKSVQKEEQANKVNENSEEKKIGEEDKEDDKQEVSVENSKPEKNDSENKKYTSEEENAENKEITKESNEDNKNKESSEDKNETDHQNKETINTEDDEIASNLTSNITTENNNQKELTLTLATDEATIWNGNAFNPESFITSLSDENNSLPNLQIDNTVNTKKDGLYTVTYKVIGMSGKSIEKQLTVKVKTPEEIIKKRIEEKKKKEEAEKAARKAAQEKARKQAEQAKIQYYASKNINLNIGQPAVDPVGASLNPYPIPDGYWSNCTWGAWQLVYQNEGIKLPSFGNASEWYYDAIAAGFAVDSNPRIGDVAVYGGGNGLGHVAYVAQVSADGNSVYVLQGNYGGGYTEKWNSRYSTSYSGMPLLGYIHVN